jgi:hypothetical protein
MLSYKEGLFIKTVFLKKIENVIPGLRKYWIVISLLAYGVRHHPGTAESLSLML